MSYTLRKYQEKAVSDGLNYFSSKEKKNMMMCLPTAAGKSLIVANIARKLEDKVLCLQPSKELLVQNYNKFISYGNKASIFSASLNKKEVGEVTFATIGSIYTKPELFKDFKYIISDECHLMSPKKGSMNESFLNELNIPICGLTATPFRLKAYSYPDRHSKLNMLNRARPRLFHDFIHVTQIKEMVENEYWSPLHYITNEFDTSKLVLNSTRANYTDKSIHNSIQSQNVVENALNWAKKLKKEGRKKILIFAPDIETSNYIAGKLGLNSVTSYTSNEDREIYVNRFINGLDWGLVNVSIFSVGFDCQQIDAVIDLSPTLSLARYYQKIGRGVRVDLSNNPTKKDCIVVDLAGNKEMFGKVEDLVVEQIDGKWCVTSNKKILTNTPLTKQEPIPEFGENIMEFGKFKGDKFKNIPNWYWKWVDKNIREDIRNREMFRYIRSVL